MFIDIVGFSVVSENLGSNQSFERISHWLNEVYKVVKKHGGNIDRSLGDGLLCFFGFNSSRADLPANSAFLAAIEIQNMSASKLSDKAHDHWAFPMRIGLNTDTVVIGNLGGDLRSDYTMIGNGVNFASRLEAACNMFRISMSSHTKELIDPNLYEKKSMNQIYLNIKHFKQYVEAFECAPAARHRGGFAGRHSAGRRLCTALGRLGNTGREKVRARNRGAEPAPARRARIRRGLVDGAVYRRYGRGHRIAAAALFHTARRRGWCLANAAARGRRGGPPTD